MGGVGTRVASHRRPGQWVTLRTQRHSFNAVDTLALRGAYGSESATLCTASDVQSALGYELAALLRQQCESFQKRRIPLVSSNLPPPTQNTVNDRRKYLMTSVIHTRKICHVLTIYSYSSVSSRPFFQRITRLKCAANTTSYA